MTRTNRAQANIEREERARTVLAAAYAASGDEQMAQAMRFVRRDALVNTPVFRAMLAFADEELERAAAICQTGGWGVGILQGKIWDVGQANRTATAIRALKGEG